MSIFRVSFKHALTKCRFSWDGRKSLINCDMSHINFELFVKFPHKIVSGTGLNDDFFRHYSVPISGKYRGNIMEITMKYQGNIMEISVK